MKITVRNLGPISAEAQFELKPLTIFIGPNNSGKTWLAYVLAAVFGELGLREFITTHSPYMIDHFGNLTKASQHSEKERIQQEFYLQDSRAFIDENKVSMYFIGKGTAQDTLHDEELDWDTFGDVSDRLNEIYFSL
jgi:predicted ATPase